MNDEIVTEPVQIDEPYVDDSPDEPPPPEVDQIDESPKNATVPE